MTNVPAAALPNMRPFERVEQLSRSQRMPVSVSIIRLPAVLVLLAFTALCSPAQERAGLPDAIAPGGKGGNPVFSGADPHAIALGNQIWVYPTWSERGRQQFFAFASTNLIDWERHGPVLDFRDVSWIKDDGAPVHYAWAPTLFTNNGKYYFYYSVGPQNPTASRLGVAVGDSPSGPFVDSGKPLFVGGNGFEAIDPMVFRDPESGKVFLYAGGSAGAKLRVWELNPDLVSFAREIPVETPTNFTEAAFMHYHEGRYYLSYSHGGWRHSSYSVHYASSASPTGPWSYHGAILASDAVRKGPGHHSFLKDPVSGEWLIFYHRWENQTGDGPYRGSRQVCVDRVQHDAEGLIRPIAMTSRGLKEASVSNHVSAADVWSRFRGPNGSGVADGAMPPVDPGTNTLAWKRAIPSGLSSPVLAGSRVFLTGLDNGRLATFALDRASGQLAWRREAPEVAIENVHSFNSPATPSPCADDERVYVYFGSYGLICYDLDGREVWKKAIPTPKNLYGTASSPIMHRNLLILVLDDDANLSESKMSRSRMLALDKVTGESVWETARPLHRSGWSTPAIWRHSDGEELVVLGSGRLAGYNLQTGAEKWFVTGFARETAVVPVFGDGMVFASSAMGGIAEENPDPEPLWKAMLYFDANRDGRIGASEMTEHFTFPLRPEVPPTHPGFGVPVPSDPARRAERQRGIFAGIDKDHDGFWTREEFVANLGPRPFKPWLAAVRSGGAGDCTETHIAWELKRSIPEIPSALYYDHRLYLVRNGGILTAVDAASGKVLYEERLGAPGQYSSSPVIANRYLYLVSNKGIVSVVKTGGPFELVHQHDVGEAAFVTPAIDRDTLYIRTEGHLQAFRSR